MDYEKMLERERIKNEAKARKEKERLQAHWRRKKAAIEMEELDAEYERKLIALDGIPSSGADRARILREWREATDEMERTHKRQWSQTKEGKCDIWEGCREIEQRREPEIARAYRESDYARADRLRRERDAEIAEYKREMRGAPPPPDPKWENDELQAE